MTIIYIVEVDDVDNGEKSIQTFDTHAVALAQAGIEMIEAMRCWDLDDEGDRGTAIIVQNLITAGDIMGAFPIFNDWACNSNSPVYIFLRQETVKSSVRGKHRWIDFSQYGDGDDEFNVPATLSVVASNTPFVATSPGATCRGPCGNPSLDAYADRQDGTFLCFQCKLMKQAFGN